MAEFARILPTGHLLAENFAFEGAQVDVVAVLQNAVVRRNSVKVMKPTMMATDSG